MKKKIMMLWLLTTMATVSSFAQEPMQAKRKRKPGYLGIAITNSHTAMPFSKLSSLVTGTYHPGIELSTGFNWKTKPKHDWLQTFDIGYSYHRWVQHSILLYAEFGYRYKFPAGFAAETKIGAGYMRAIVATQSFSDGIEDEKQYSKISAGRSQAMATVSFGISKSINRRSAAFLQYQQRIQTPFIQSYVPLLPYNVLKVGITVSLKDKTKNNQP